MSSTFIRNKSAFNLQEIRMTLEQQLQQFGLKEKEAKIYLALLELGQSPIQDIAKKSGVKRTSVYDILEHLIKLGFTTVMTKKKHRVYFAEEPEKIKNFLLGKQREIKEKIQGLDEILPELKNLFNISAIPRPKIKFFEGTEEIKKIFDDVLNCKSKEYWYITSRKKLKELVGEEYLDEHIKKRVAAKIKCYSLRTEEDKTEDQYSRSHRDELREVCYLPPKINFTNTICVYDNKVAVISSKKENYGFIVESDELAETMMMFIKMLWKNYCVKNK